MTNPKSTTTNAAIAPHPANRLGLDYLAAAVKLAVPLSGIIDCSRYGTKAQQYVPLEELLDRYVSSSLRNTR